MRHNVAGRKLGRTTPHRQSMFRNQLASLVKEERIVTTLPKAKELRPIAERVVTHGKDDTVSARRWVVRWLPDRDLIKKLFTELAPRFAERAGGYLRIVKLGPRSGDGAEMASLQFVDYQPKAAQPAPGTEKGGAAKPAKGAKEAKPAKAKVGGGKANRPAKGEKVERAEREAKAKETPQGKRTKTARDVAAASGESAKKGRAKKGATE